MKKIIFNTFILFIILLIGLSLYSYHNLNKNISSTNEIIITIPSSTSKIDIIKTFNSKGLLKPAWMYIILTKSYSFITNHQIVAGVYRILPNNTNFQILKAIFSGKQLYIVKITFPEGITIYDFASIASKKLGIDSSKFIHLASNDSLLKARNINARNVEGYLFPNTYLFRWKCPITEIIDKLLDSQEDIWNKRFAQFAQDNDKLKHEILTLASIIEAETPVVSEKKRIAGVYHNRLKLGMLLQADPTIQYAMKSKNKISRQSLELNSLYNTYKYYGLPPGPINSPSISSIDAAFNPENHNYIYFVAVGDGSGKHNFAKNFAEHRTNINVYRHNKKKIT
jgi:UPF0755 protein